MDVRAYLLMASCAPPQEAPPGIPQEDPRAAAAGEPAPPAAGVHAPEKSPGQGRPS
jgi:hypothetical protein